MKRSQTILIISNTPKHCALLRNIFEEHYQVAEAENDAAVLDLLRYHIHVDAIFLDLLVPDESALSLLQKLQETPELASIPVIVLTAEDDEETRIHAFELGAVEVIDRPLSSRITQLRVRNILKQRDAKLLDKEDEIMRLRLAQQEKLLQVAQIDEKTGMNNPQTFYRKTAELLARHPEEKFMIVHWDIDRFKAYNDLFGIAEGDRLLREIGKRFADYPDLISGHLQADHFVYCISEERFHAERIVEVVVTGLSEYNPDFEFMPRFGIYRIEDHTMDVSLMCDRALLALLSLKGSYTERLAYYNEGMREHLLEEQQMLREIHVALSSRQFHLYFQPQYNHVSGVMIGAEVLVRWIHPEKGLIAPGIFIPLLEKNGFITKLDEYIWEEACSLLQKWIRAGVSPVPISVNLSRIDVYHPRLCDTLCGLIEKYQVPVQLLRLEITESAFPDHPKEMIQIVQRLKAHGFWVEMDDFGSGYSSLNLLKDVPVDLIKLDMHFLDDTTNEQKGRGILYSIMQMTRMLSIPVMAEGVETAEQAAFLKEIGCEMVQGYWYNRPMPLEEFETLLQGYEEEQPKLALLQNLNDITQEYVNLLRWMYDHKMDLFSLLLRLPLGALLYEASNPPKHIFGNNRFFELLGIPREQVKAERLAPIDLLPKKAREHIRRMVESSNLRTQVSAEDFRIKREDGTGEWYRCSVCVVSNIEGSVPVHMVFFEDITREKELEDQRSEGYQQWQDEKYRILMETSNCLLFDYNPLTDVLILSDSGNRMKEQSTVHYLETLPDSDRIHPEDRDLVRALLENQEDEYPTIDYRARYEHDEVEYWYRATTTNLRDESGKVYRVVGKVENVQAQYEQSKKEQNLLEQAERDALTGLYNRQIETRISAILTEVGYGSLFMLDLDDFKYINDIYGHVAGDAVLIHMGEILQSIFRASDYIYRAGGDEFIVFMPGVHTEALLAEKAKAILEKAGEVFAYKEKEMSLSCSIGIAVCPDHGLTLTDMMSAADQAMYQVKKLSKKDFAFYRKLETGGTQLYEMEQQYMARTAQQMETVFQAIPGGIALYRYTDRLETVYFTDGVAALSDMGRDEYNRWISADSLVAVYEEDRPRILHNLGKAIANNSDIDEQYRIYRKDGSYLWIHATGRVLPNRENGVMIHVLFQEMSKYSMLYYGVLDGLSESICVSDPTSHEILYMNAAACRLAGIKQGAYIGKKCHEVLWQCGQTCGDCPLCKQEGECTIKRTRYVPELGKHFQITSHIMDWNGVRVQVEGLEELPALPTEETNE